MNNGWRLVVGGWWRLVVGGWWRLAVGGWWRLAVGGWWLVAVGGWQLVVQLAVDGPWGLYLNAVLDKKNGVLKDSPAAEITEWLIPNQTVALLAKGPERRGWILPSPAPPPRQICGK